MTLLPMTLGVIDTAAADTVTQPLFQESAPLELELDAPFRRLSQNREDEAELSAVLRYRAPDGREVAVELKIEPRGVSRLRHCSFPPLRLDFDETAVAGTVFEGQDRLKLVTHCMRSGSYRTAVAREYQIYRSYHLLTDRSFLVRWVSIEYRDTESRRKPFVEAGFLIEEDWAVAARLGMELVEPETLDVAELDPAETAAMALFQYMIGNVDWSAARGSPDEPCCHNGKVIRPLGQLTGHVVLPYDFDQSGFVDAQYAVHNESLGLRRGERSYRGFCAFNDEVEGALARIRAVEDDWLKIVDAEPVREQARRWGVRYIEGAFEAVADAERRQRSFEDDCRP